MNNLIKTLYQFVVRYLFFSFVLFYFDKSSSLDVAGREEATCQHGQKASEAWNRSMKIMKRHRRTDDVMKSCHDGFGPRAPAYKECMDFFSQSRTEIKRTPNGAKKVQNHDLGFLLCEYAPALPQATRKIPQILFLQDLMPKEIGYEGTELYGVQIPTNSSGKPWRKI